MTKPEIILKDIPLLNQRLFLKTVKDFFNKLELSSQPVVEIACLPKLKMKELNKKYRQKNQFAEALSFPIWENITFIPNSRTIKPSPKILLGNIFLNDESLKDRQKVRQLICHSLQHLLGKHH